MFPTTLREISKPWLIKVCVEHNARRYFVGQANEFATVEAMAEPYTGRRGVRVYATEKSDSTHIDGGKNELIAAIT